MTQIIKTDSVDFNALINQNTTLNIDSKTKMFEILKNEFTPEQLRWYIANLCIYMIYHPTTDFPINLETLVKLVGFKHKANAKRTLKNNFVEGVDYKILLVPKDEQVLHGGHNEEKIMMNIDTFKNMCMLVKTEKSKSIRRYYVKLENIYNNIVKEEIENQKLIQENTQKLLQEKELELLQTKRQLEQKTKLKVKRWYDSEPGDIIYAYKSQENNSLITIGKTKNVKDRERNYLTHNQNGDMFFIRKCFNCDLAEKVLHHMLDKFREENNKEWFEITQELAIYMINLVCNFLDNFINKIDELQNTTLSSDILNITKLLDLQINNNDNNDKTTDKKTEKEIIFEEFDYDKFINECCEIDPNYYCIPDELLGAYKLWSRINIDTSRKNLLFNFLKTKYRMDKKYIELYQSKIQGFIGIKPKVIKNNIENIQIKNFLIENCDIGYIYKITEKSFLDSYTNWIKREITNDELIEIKADLNKNFYFGNINYSKEKKKYGYVGFKLKTDKETIHCLRNKNTKKINKININTKKIEHEFISGIEAANILKIDIRTVQAYLKHKKIFNKCYILDYKE